MTRPSSYRSALGAFRSPIALALFTLLDAACSGDILPPAGELASVVVAPDTVTLTAGQSRSLTATAYGRNGAVLPGLIVAWASSDTAIAAVDSAGRVAARRSGQATVTATILGKHAQALIRVQAVPPAAVARVEIVPAGQIDLRSGSIRQLQVRSYAADGTELFARPVTWSSSDPRIAQVDSNHVLKGAELGLAAITASVEGRTAVLVVQVLSQVASIELDPQWLAVAPGEAGVIRATAKDEAGNRLNKAITWSTSDPTVATVAGAGRVTGVSLGSALVTATVEGVSAQLRVGVGTWMERKLIALDSAAPPLVLFKLTRTDSVGTGTTTWVEVRSGRLRLLAGGPAHGRYEQRFDVTFLRDGQLPQYGELVFPGTYERDLTGAVTFRTVNDEVLPMQRLGDGRIAITGTGRITIAGQEVSSGTTFLYNAQ